MQPEHSQQIDQNLITPGRGCHVHQSARRGSDRYRHASRGQILILIAGALVAIVGMLGLATDLGYNFAQRRTMQNAADAGALAGAHTLSKRATLGPSVLPDVQSAVVANKLGSSTPSIMSCIYVDDTDKDLGNCSLVVPSKATGVHVTVRETHDTFFLRAIPGGPNSMSTAATAIAHVQYLKTPPGDGPLLVCGIQTKVETNGNQYMDLVSKDTSGNWQINSTAVPYTFRIYGPSISTCDLDPQSYKGLAYGGVNKNLTVPGYLYFTNGTATGNLAVSQVQGVNGCDPSRIINCIAFLPVAVNTPPPDKLAQKMYAVMILPFYITGVKDSNGNLNKLDGKLMPDYITQGDGTIGFIPGTSKPLVIRLTK